VIFYWFEKALHAPIAHNDMETAVSITITDIDICSTFYQENELISRIAAFIISA
jgi:hypothetical protein